MKTKYLHLLIFLFVSYQSYSQEDMSQYFDDGGAARKKNIVFINLAPMINGDFGVNYQGRLTDIFYLEAGAGLLTPNFRMSPLLMFEHFEYANLSKGGRSFFLYPKFEYSGDERYSCTAGLKYRNRAYKDGSNRMLSVKDYLLSFNCTYNLGKNFVFDYGMGFGPSFYETPSEKDYTMSVPFDFKIGYIF